VSERHPILERLTRWSIARTAILRAAGTHNSTHITPEEARAALEEAYQVVLDLREMADSVEADLHNVINMAEDFLQDEAKHG